jgi:class I fructose-bisphosphate aldolase
MADGGADAVVLHKGCVVAGSRDNPEKDLGLIVHLSASTSMGDSIRKRLVCTVEEALRLGADGVSLHINFGNKHEEEMLEQLGMVSEKIRYWGIPLMVMAYPRGEYVEARMREDNGVSFSEEKKIKEMSGLIKHAARAVFELGASIIKISYTGDIASFQEITQSCPVPIVIAGGPKMDTDKELLQMVYDSIKAGGAGTSIGRNIFQHKGPEKMIKAISAIVHGDATVEGAMNILDN